MSVANLNPGSPRFAAVVVAAYIMVIGSLVLLNQEYKWYIEFRHKFLSLRIPRNFAVYVSGIPEALQSDHALTDFFQRSRWTSTVLEANVAMNIPKLEAKVAKREIVLQNLEHAMALEKLKGKVTTHRTFKIQNATSDIMNVSQMVDSVQTYRRQLDELNKQISLEIGKVKNSNHRLRRHLTKQQCDSNILRGRTLTPCYDELRSDLDLESGTHFFNHDNSMLSMDVDEGDNSFYWQNSAALDSRNSILEQQPIITDEIPEEETHVPDVDFEILPVVNSGDAEDEQSIESMIESVDGKDEDIGSPIPECEEGQPELSDRATNTSPLPAAHGDVENHPFLQLMGMAELHEPGGSTSMLSVQSSLGDTQGDELSPSHNEPSSQDDSHRCEESPLQTETAEYLSSSMDQE
ncbi:MAG: hypothetical protein SGILL_004601, partial [Bacillariaceae sp.]